MTPSPGDSYANAFVAEAGQFWRMVFGRNDQATHCAETPIWTGRWLAPNGERWWQVWSCPEHLEGLTGSEGVWAAASRTMNQRLRFSYSEMTANRSSLLMSTGLGPLITSSRRSPKCSLYRSQWRSTCARYVA